MPELDSGIPYDYVDEETGHKMRRETGQSPGEGKTVLDGAIDMTVIFEKRGDAPTTDPEILAYSRVYGESNHHPANKETELAARRKEFQIRQSDDDVAGPHESGMTLPPEEVETDE